MEKLSSFEDKKSELQIDGSKIFEEEVQLQELDNIERQIEQIRKMEGINSISISHLCINATNLCNILSNNQSKLLFLERAIKLSEYDDEASMLAYINLSSYYRKIGEYKQAATYLEKSLCISVRLNKDDSRVDTHLSLGTVYSQLGRHDFAKRHIQSAIMLLQMKIADVFVPKADIKMRKEALENFESASITFKDNIALLSICYHNLAIEYEFLNNLEEALNSYNKAKTTAQDYLGEEDVLALNLEDVYIKAKDAIESITDKKTSKKSIIKTTLSHQQ